MIKKERIALDRLADFLVEDILSASDEELLAEFRESYGDPVKHAKAMGTLFEKTLLTLNKERLAAAKAKVAEKNNRPSISFAARPLDIQAVRARLRRFIETPGSRPMVTLAARKESELSDVDIIGMLNDLRELGILPPDDENGEC
jgi:hypothetical protein